MSHEPGMVRGLLRAVHRGVCAVSEDLDLAIEAVARRNPHIDRAANRARLAGTLALEMGHSEGAAMGTGDVDPRRLERAIALIVQAKGYTRTPQVAEIFNAEFLPPLTERRLAYHLLSTYRLT